ncbi:MAG: hypothetical protein LBN95_00840 [Prevotellaceae bacterium]|jgi:uncharacterized protein YxjI|nr:hypothetical protein [Prevotellaceae bacterium]
MKEFPKFFDNNDYFIDEKVGFLKFHNAYKVFNKDGEQIGNITEKMSVGKKMLTLLLNKAMFPFRIEIRDMEDNLLASVTRGWTFFMSKITILDADNEAIAIIKQKFKMFKPEFKILDLNENELAKIAGDWKAWNFAITTNDSKSIGTISKKWNGILKESFTTADKYIVSVAPELKEDLLKIIIVSSAITIDMVLKESK